MGNACVQKTPRGASLALPSIPEPSDDLKNKVRVGQRAVDQCDGKDLWGPCSSPCPARLVQSKEPDRLAPLVQRTPGRGLCCAELSWLGKGSQGAALT